MEINENVKHLWNAKTQTFFNSYYGNDLMYWHATIGEWVYPDDANFYPEEITDWTNEGYVEIDHPEYNDG